MHTLLAQNYKRTAWKNGAGETIQIAISPPGAGLDDFIWRISMATIATDAEFSDFPGIDRTIVALDGGGVTLRLPGIRRVLRPGDGPFRFSGDVPVSAELMSGPVTDFNVMSRRADMSHRVELLSVGDSRLGSGEISAIFALEDVRLRLPNQTIQLGKWDLQFLNRSSPVTLETGSALHIHLEYA